MICKSCERDIFRSCAKSLQGKMVNCLAFHCESPEECSGEDIRWGLEDIQIEARRWRIQERDKNG